MNYLQNLRIHLISLHQTQNIPIPDSLEILKSVVSNAFHTLPQQWDLTYINSENHETPLHSEQDFHDLLANTLRVSSKAIMIFIKERKSNPEPAQDLEFQVIDEKSEAGAESQVNIFQQVADLRKAFESNKTSQLSRDSVLSAISQFVMAQNVNFNIPAVVRQQIPQPQQQEPKGKVPEGGSLANLMIGEQTLEDMFQRMINKNIHNIASKTANILQNRGIQLQDQPQAQAQAAHEDSRCHECGVSPIVGIKYKCLACPDYELCEACESIHDHVHALMKIKRPGQQFQLPQEEHGGYSKPMSLVQSDYFEVPVQQEEKPVEDEEEKSSLSQKNRVGGIKKSVTFDLEPEVLEIIKEEEPKIEDKQVPEEEKVDLGADKKEEEKPVEIHQDNFLISQEVKKVYSAEVIEKAKQLHELLPEASLEQLLEFVNNSASDVDVVELMERFQLL